MSDFNDQIRAFSNVAPVKITEAKPFVKWVGGKRSIVPALIELAPHNYNLYCEPFVGGGALYWALKPSKAVLMDSNEELVITYKIVQTKPARLISLLKEHEENHRKGREEYYRRVRGNSHEDAEQVAARFVFLNRTGYNGLYRVNQKGEFNVPYGKYENPLICNEKTIMECHQALQGVEIRLGTFERSNVFAEEGNFYYLDPPYAGTYNSYRKEGFSEDLQKKLMEFCKALHKKGVKFMLSNSDTPLIRDLYRYKHFNIREIKAPRYVSCKSDGRVKVTELLINNYA